MIRGDRQEIARQVRNDVALYSASIGLGALLLLGKVFPTSPWGRFTSIFDVSLMMIPFALSSNPRRGTTAALLAFLPTATYCSWLHPERAPTIVASLIGMFYLCVSLPRITAWFRRVSDRISRRR